MTDRSSTRAKAGAEHPTTTDVSSGGGTGAPVALPWSIQLATGAIVLEVLFSLLQIVSVRGYTPQFTHWLTVQNAKAKTPVKDYATHVAHYLSQMRTSVLIQGLVICVALAILGVSVRRARGAGGARWALIIVLVLTETPFYAVPLSGWPAIPKFARVGMGLMSIVAILSVLMPQSMQYFRACKAATRPAGAPVRPGLGSLFGPRGGAGVGGGGGFGGRNAQRGRTVTVEPVSSSTAERGRAKAKGRADADAVAKGAELARTRAKASKSRRTEP